MSVDPEIFLIFQHKVEWTPHFTRVTEVRHMYTSYYDYIFYLGLCFSILPAHRFKQGWSCGF